MVNNEYGELLNGLMVVEWVFKSGGLLVVVIFYFIEDCMVKKFMVECVGCVGGGNCYVFEVV